MRLKKVGIFIALCCLLFASCSGPTASYSSVSSDASVPTTRTQESKDYSRQEPGKDKTTVQTETTTEAKQPEKITISFIGDCVIATADGKAGTGSFNWTAEREPPSYFFDKVDEIFFKDDITVADCENVFTDSELEPVEKEGDAFWFKSAAKNACILASGGVDVVSLANNHTRDYGEQGFNDTKKAIQDAGLKIGYNNNPVIIEKKGVRIGIICCGLWAYGQYARATKQIEEIESRTDIQIVYFHGGQENIHQPEEWKMAAARKIVDAGADLVVGSHPHVLQPVKIYRGVPIVYSLGNFVYGGNRKPENRTIIFQAFFEVLNGEVKVTHDIIPCYVYTGKVNNWQPDKIIDQSEKEKVLEFMNGRRELPY